MVSDAEEQTPTALVIGYVLTASGFLLFFGPLSVVTSLRGATDRRKHRCTREDGQVEPLKMFGHPTKLWMPPPPSRPRPRSRIPICHSSAPARLIASTPACVAA